MLNAKLILIEGIPGAGKTTSCEHLGRTLRHQGIACRWYLEDDYPHPIDCLYYILDDLPQKLPLLWSTFAVQASQENFVTISESRLWQNTLLFMFMSEYPIDEIVEVHKSVWQELRTLSPVLIYLHQDDIELALKRLNTLRGKDLVDKDILTTSQYPWFQSRRLNDINGWVQFFKEWQMVANDLYRDWPFRKTKIRNPHDNWGQAYKQIYDFCMLSNTGG